MLGLLNALTANLLLRTKQFWVAKQVGEGGSECLGEGRGHMGLDPTVNLAPSDAEGK